MDPFLTAAVAALATGAVEAARRLKKEPEPLVSSIDFTKEAASLPMEIWENPP
jgi:hypothetical protein